MSCRRILFTRTYVIFNAFTFTASCHALHLGNCSSELMCFENIHQFVDSRTLPLLPHLLSRTPAVAQHLTLQPSVQEQIQLMTSESIEKHNLNEFQAVAMRKIAAMFLSEPNNASPVTLIHGSSCCVVLANVAHQKAALSTEFCFRGFRCGKKLSHGCSHRAFREGAHTFGKSF